jgi:CheY-like chemotaxis protein
MRILVIDDESTVRLVTRLALKAHGYEVVEAASGARGVEALRGRRRRCCVVRPVHAGHLFMPDIDGLEVIRVLSRTGIPVVAMSGGFGDGDLLDAATFLGAACVLCKPFTPEDLRAAVLSSLAVRASLTDV